MSQGGEGVFMITLLDKLEAAQAEIERLTAELGDLPEAQADMLHTIKELRARLAEIEAQNLMARQIILEHGEGVAGASLVATPIVAWAKSTSRKLRITTMDMGGEDGWRPLGYTEAGA